MDHVDEGNDIFNGRLRQNAVAQIENMARPSGRPLKNLFYFTAQVFATCKQRHWIEVSHHRLIKTDSLPPVVQRDSPINSDNLTAGFADKLQQLARAGAKVNDRYSWFYAGDHTAR